MDLETKKKNTEEGLLQAQEKMKQLEREYQENYQRALYLQGVLDTLNSLVIEKNE